MKIKAEKQFSSGEHQKSGFKDFLMRFFVSGAKLSSYSTDLLVFVASLMDLTQLNRREGYNLARNMNLLDAEIFLNFDAQ